MRKLLLSLLFLTIVPFIGFAQQKCVVVSNAGSLASVLPEASANTINRLKISGDLNGTDFLLIHSMAGVNGALSYLDLSEANIVKGGQSYSNVGSLGNLYTENDELTSNIFANCVRLKSITIPNTVAAVNNSAFSSCPNLEEIKTVGNKNFISISGILYSADSTTLVRCPQGKTVVHCNILSTVKHINVSAFRGVKTITSVTFPAGLLDVNDFSFYGCPNVKEIRSNASQPPFYESAFDAKIQSKTTVIVPTGSAESYKSEDGWNAFAKIRED